jgi:hypothetical protein
MDQLRPNPPARHSSPAILVHKDLKESTIVFLRHEGIRRALEPPYSGLLKVIAHTKKTFKIVVAADKSPYPQAEFKQLTYWENISKTPAVHQLIPAGLQ